MSLHVTLVPMTKPAKPEQPDEIQRQFWQYRRVRVGVILGLLAASILLPKIPLLRGWEHKFSAAVIELGKSDVPSDASRVDTAAEIKTFFSSEIQIPSEALEVKGPLPIAAWKCKPLGAPGACIRYMWEGEKLTLVVSTKPGKIHKTSEPFIKAGWGGYFVFKENLGYALIGPEDPQILLQMWPFGQKTRINLVQPQ